MKVIRFWPAPLMVLLLLISSLGLASMGSAGPEGLAPLEPPTRAGDKWTFIIYMAGDNSLGDNGSSGGNQVWSDLNEIEAALSGVTDVNIIVLADEIGVGDTRCYEVAYGTGDNLTSPTIPLSNINATWLNELDMGNPQNLIDFASWSVANYPADKYYLELWNHGSGCFRRGRGRDGGSDTRYIGIDNHGTSLDMEDLRVSMEEIFTNTGVTFDAFTMDACLMGMAEIYYQVYPYAKIVVGSQEEDPWEGFDYTFLEKLKDDPGMSAEALSAHIVDYFYDSYTDGQPDPADVNFHTLAAVNLTKMFGALNTSFDAWAQELIARAYYYSSTGTNEYFTHRSQTEEFRTSSYVDMMHFIERILLGNYGSIVEKASIDLWQGLNASVITSKAGSTNPNANGISIYFPKYKSYYANAYNGDVSDLLFPKDTLWDEFLHEFYTPTMKVNITLQLRALDGDELLDDAFVNFRMLDNTTLSGAKVYVNGILEGVTDSQGNYSKANLPAGLHRFELVHNTLVGIADANVKNKIPTAGFSISNSTVFEDQLIIFNGSLSSDPEDDPLHFYWDFDAADGLNFTNAQGINVNHSYSYNGEYTVSLMVNDSHSSSFIQKNVTVENMVPEVIVTPGTIDAFEDEQVLLDGSKTWDSASDMGYLEFMWVYGDGESANWSASPTKKYSYSDQGQYTATLYVRDDNKAVGEADVLVNVANAVPVSFFKLTGTAYNSSSTGVTLLENTVYPLDGTVSTDTPSDDNGLTSLWNFSFASNDSIYSNYDEKLITHRFQKKGSWDISLTVTDDDGASDTAVLRVVIANRPPKAVASLNGTVVGYEEEPVYFDAGNSTDSLEDLPSLRYLWDLDGDDIYESSGLNVAYSYPKSGFYTAKLKVYDGANASDVDVFSVWILNRAPRILLEPEYNIFEDEVILFSIDDVLDSQEDLGAMKMAWDLDGDGAFEDRSDSIQISYPRQGVYNISLTAMDPEQLSDSVTVLLIVENAAPTALFTNRRGDSSLEMRFFGNKSKDTPSDMSTLIYFWDFGDSKSSYEVNPVHKYKKPGTYNVTLSVTDDDGAIDRYHVIIIIKDDEPSYYWAYGLVLGVIILALAGIYVLYVVEKRREKQRLEDAREALRETEKKSRKAGRAGTGSAAARPGGGRTKKGRAVTDEEEDEWEEEDEEE